MLIINIYLTGHTCLPLVKIRKVKWLHTVCIIIYHWQAFEDLTISFHDVILFFLLKSFIIRHCSVLLSSVHSPLWSSLFSSTRTSGPIILFLYFCRFRQNIRRVISTYIDFSKGVCILEIYEIYNPDRFSSKFCQKTACLI